MKEKTLKELYTILFNNINFLKKEPETIKYFDDEEKGLCDLISFLEKGHPILKKDNHFGEVWTWKHYYNRHEANILYKDFIKRKPKWYNSKFWWNKSFNKFNLDNKFHRKSYWWELNEKGNIQRKLFIESIIKKL